MQEPWYDRWKIGGHSVSLLIVTSIFIGLVTYWFYGAVDSTLVSRQVSQNGSAGSSELNTQIWTYCQQIVKERLKAPATADFPWDMKVTSSPNGKTMTVVSYVDSQNSFGAKLRTHYVCQLERFGDGAADWKLKELTFVK
jgi:hypothetical protein